MSTPPPIKKSKVEVENQPEGAPSARRCSADASPPSDEEKMEEVMKLVEDTAAAKSIDDNLRDEFILKWKIDAVNRIIGKEESGELECMHYVGKYFTWNAKCFIARWEECKEHCICYMFKYCDPHGPVARFSLWGAPTEAVLRRVRFSDLPEYAVEVDLDVSLLKADDSLEYICKKKRLTFSGEYKSSEYDDDCKCTVDPDLLTDKELYCIDDQVTVQFHIRIIRTRGFKENVRERTKEEMEKSEKKTRSEIRRTAKVNHQVTIEFTKLDNP